MNLVRRFSPLPLCCSRCVRFKCASRAERPADASVFTTASVCTPLYTKTHTYTQQHFAPEHDGKCEEICLPVTPSLQRSEVKCSRIFCAVNTTAEGHWLCLRQSPPPPLFFGVCILHTKQNIKSKESLEQKSSDLQLLTAASIMTLFSCLSCAHYCFTYNTALTNVMCFFFSFSN